MQESILVYCSKGYMQADKVLEEDQSSTSESTGKEWHIGHSLGIWDLKPNP